MGWQKWHVKSDLNDHKWSEESYCVNNRISALVFINIQFRCYVVIKTTFKLKFEHQDQINNNVLGLQYFKK